MDELKEIHVLAVVNFGLEILKAGKEKEFSSVAGRL